MKSLFHVAAAAILTGTPLPLAFAQPGEPAAAPRAAMSAATFTVTFDKTLQPTPYSGRVYLVFAKGERPEPRQQIDDWFTGAEIVSLDVKNIAPGGSVTIDGAAATLGYPSAFAAIEPGVYRVQAVARRNTELCHPGVDAGDLYSEPMRVAFTREATEAASPATLNLAAEATAKPFRETDRIKLVEIVSPSLTKFYGHETKVRASVMLPADYKDDTGATYSTVYFITGFGSDHRSIAMMRGFAPKEGPGSHCLIVCPDPTCALGHSVFADSENNGPRGESLVHELIPEVEKRFHGAGSAEKRYVTGISSGGWSSLWLQVTYPETFNGCWSHCPDPVDFRDFQRADVYAPHANIYKDEKGERRPLARQGEKVMLWYDDFVKRETVIGPGGQIHSFEAVFSPRGEDGTPRLAFDRATGEIYPAVAKTWEKYDIRLVLERNWATLAPKLKGKIHIYAGGMDTFYLEGAVKRLQETLKTIDPENAAMVGIKIVPGMPHMISPTGMKEMWEAIGG